MEGYFEWLVKRIYPDGIYKYPYSKLAIQLFNTPFEVMLPMDSNRCTDGTILRKEYGIRDSSPCSLLELFVGFSIRIEEDLMYDADKGDRVPLWFDIMIKNLGLKKFTDNCYNSIKVATILQKFNKRDYSPDGNGSMFFIPGTKNDLRQVEIWYQMHEYFGTFYSF